jgi:magnesium chelatase subunit H
MQKRITPAEALPQGRGDAMSASSQASMPIRVVLVTLDSHVVGAAERAQRQLVAKLPGLRFQVHAASEWGDDAQALQDCVQDIGRADIVLVTMLFMEDHFLPVLEALKARRDHCDAMVCAMSAGEVMRLTRMGRFEMQGGGGGLMGLLKRLRGMGSKSNAPGPGDAPPTRDDASRSNGHASGAAQMKMLRRLPQLLRFIPGTAQDLRAYFLVLQYWLAGSDENMANLVQLLVSRYASGPRQVLRDRVQAQPPREYPEVGVYHPALPERLLADASKLPKPDGMRGTVGLLLMRSYLLAGNCAHYDGVIAALEMRGLRVIPAFASGLDARPAVERFFMDAHGRPLVDTMVSLTGFSLVGGPAYNDAQAAEEMLAKLNVPYIAATPVEFQSLDQWQSSSRGLLPVEATMMVAIPELDGATGSMVFGGRGGQAHDMVVSSERAAMLAARVAKWVHLRRGEAATRKLGVVLFNFPPNSGAAGTAAFLSVFESLHNLLLGLRARGYSVDVPATVDELRKRLLEGNSAALGSAANVHARIAVNDHVAREVHLDAIEKQWGAAPGKHQTDGASIHVLGERFGNVFVGLQPAFGVEGDPMRLLFDGGFAPTHAFSAFYRWMREDFGADALLHFGTHGALEFMPGKQVGLSAECWPDRLVGDMPNVYLYASNNPSEGMLAKRRAAATLVSHLTPPVTDAGLYKGLAELQGSLDRWRALGPEEHHDRSQLLPLVQSQAVAVDLAAMEPTWTASQADSQVAALVARLHELQHTWIPHGLHVVGQPPRPKSAWTC